MAHSTNELLRAVLNSKRTPSTGGRSNGGGSKGSSRRGTPKAARSARASHAASRNVSDDEMDDNLSIASDDTWMGCDLDDVEEASDPFEGSDWEPQLQAALEAMAEKRAAAREKALAAVVKILSHVYAGEGLERSSLTCLEAVRKSVRAAKSSTECHLALCGVALWFVNFGVDSSPDDYGSVSEQLRMLVLDRSKGAGARALAMSALGLVNFIAGADYRDAAQLMDVLYKQIIEPALVARQTEDPAVVRQALESYGLLMTVVVDANMSLADQLFEAAFDAHMHALAADEIDVRVAAAQNFALVHAALASDSRHHSAGLPPLGSSPPARIQSPVFEFERQEELVATLRMLRHQSSKKHGKRDTSTQRAMMRDVLRVIESGEAPRFRLVFQGQAVLFDDWTRIVRLNAFRSVLGGGLSVHFVENPLLQDVFQVDLQSNGGDFSANAARVVVDPSSELAKARTKNMEKRRRDAQRAKSHDIDDY